MESRDSRTPAGIFSRRWRVTCMYFYGGHRSSVRLGFRLLSIMVVYCCAYGCKEKFVRGGLYTFHSFPRDENRRKEWERLIRRENFTATNASRICSKHFKNDCFDREKFGGTWLTADAKPTIFDFPSHIT